MNTAWAISETQSGKRPYEPLAHDWKPSKHQCPHYHLVPKDPEKNIAWRRKLIALCNKSEKHAKVVKKMCREDILFFLNSFAFLLEPRIPAVLPFNTYPVQDQVLLTLNSCIGKHDAGIEKSRDMGLTWCVLYVFLWRWLFHSNEMFLVASRVGDLVDSKGDPDTLFAKLDLAIAHLPNFLRPHTDRTSFHIQNLDNGAVIDGTSTTGEVGRSGRRTSILFDELPAWRLQDAKSAWEASQATTNSRIAVGTAPRMGAVGVFYDLIHKVEGSVRRFRIHWTLHPEKRIGLYTSKEGGLRILDEEYWNAHVKERRQYPFILDGKMRSIWYDAECRRTNDPTMMAREHDIDYEASSYLFFGSEFNQAIESRADIRPPLLTGVLEIDPFSGELYGFRTRSGGDLDLWCGLNEVRRPSTNGREFCVGADVSMGSGDPGQQGNSNSALAVYDRLTGEQVAEYASGSVDPIQFARIAVGLCNFFAGPDGNGAVLIWEANGPTGMAFTKEILRLGFRNCYWRQDEARVKRRPSDKPGWHSSPASKALILHGFRRGVIEGRVTMRSSKTFSEAPHFIISDDNQIVFDESMGSDDPRTSKGNHGDRIIAHALACKMLLDVKKVNHVLRQIERGRPGPDSVGGRFLMFARDEKRWSF
jgi:hypothetical protein